MHFRRRVRVARRRIRVSPCIITALAEGTRQTKHRKLGGVGQREISMAFPSRGYGACILVFSCDNEGDCLSQPRTTSLGYKREPAYHAPRRTFLGSWRPHGDPVGHYHETPVYHGPRDLLHQCQPSFFSLDAGPISQLQDTSSCCRLRDRIQRLYVIRDCESLVFREGCSILALVRVAAVSKWRRGALRG